MRITAIDEFRARLARERERLLHAVRQTDEELAALDAREPGSPQEDAPREMTTAVLSRLEGREKVELDEVDAAQARLEAGTFGTCEACHRPIGLARLRARPTARYCVRCQTRSEHARP
ncbi:MAG: TraR/DksA family transcriptional regulator [Candidatus Rokubacteria bacterium]|nr:TraR/DksA family transcriptional regulator [Candidatus Rokubacteria bacterium]